MFRGASIVGQTVWEISASKERRNDVCSFLQEDWNTALDYIQAGAGRAEYYFKEAAGNLGAVEVRF